MMFLLSFVVVIFLNLTSEISGCTEVKTFSSVHVDNCVEYKYIEVAGRRVALGRHNVRIQLEEPSRKVSLICEGRSGELSWESENKDGNQVRVSFLDGRIHVGVYWCDSFDGPTKGGIHCAVEAFSSACPGRVNVDNHTCVFEVTTQRFSSDTVRKAVEVNTEVAVVVRGKAQVSVGVSHTKEHTVVNTYTVASRSYIVIPAGYRFCSFSEVSSKKDDLVSTGFKWSCKLPKFVQTTNVSGRCTELSKCYAASPCSTTGKSAPNNTGAEFEASQPIAMLLVLIVAIAW